MSARATRSPTLIRSQARQSGQQVDRAIKLGLRCTPGYAAWLVGLAGRLRVPVAGAVDTALVKLAEGIGHEAPPPRL